MENVDRFFGAMAQDLTRSSYETWDDLVAYMEGSAAVIGEMMHPGLRPLSGAAFAPARPLGCASQLAHFLGAARAAVTRARCDRPQAAPRPHLSRHR